MTTTQLQRLLATADANDAASLDALARALQRAGFGRQAPRAEDCTVHFPFSESEAITNGWRGPFTAAQGLLRAVGEETRAAGGHCRKTNFELIAPDGSIYRGRIDVLAGRCQCLREHVTTHIRSLLALPPTHWIRADVTDEDIKALSRWLDILEP